MLSKACDKTENEFEHISRQRMADAILSVVGGRQAYGGPHNAITVVAPDGREWKAMSDGSLRDGAEFVTPILGWDDLPTYQECIRAIRRAGAQTPSRVYEVVLREKGKYELDGVFYTSLSAAAFAITGTHWNGKLFFGVKKL